MHSLTVEVASGGEVVSTPAGIDCKAPATCTASFADGTKVSLVATPVAGMVFTAFSGACEGTACTISLSADATVSARFDEVPNPCSGIEPPVDLAMHQYVSQTGDICLPGTGDAAGTLAFSSALSLSDAHGDFVDFVSPAGDLLNESNEGFFAPNVVAQPVGFMGASNEPYLGPRQIEIPSWDSRGNLSLPRVFVPGTNWSYAADPNGGLLIAGGPGQVEMFNPNASSSARFGPVALASRGVVFGAGVDLLGKSLVITDGSAAFGMGAVSAQWFGADGTPLTGEFLLIAHFTPGQNTWFEASPLLGNSAGLLVRRMDLDGTPVTTQKSLALVTLQSGSTQVSPAPQWLVSRPNVQLVITHKGHAYATVPYRAIDVPCTQRVEVLAPDGTLCGSRDYPIAAGTCTTGDVTLSLGGTVIQQLPAAMESATAFDGNHTCTWRYWPGALQAAPGEH
jgi:hypothetical protein